MLSEQQSESIDTLDTIIETNVSSDRINKTLKTRLVMDKTRGMVKVQQLDATGNSVNAEILVQGTTVSVHGRQGGWKTLPMDKQSQSMLESMGVQFGANSKGGIAGLEKSDGGAVAAAKAANLATHVASSSSVQSDSSLASASPEGRLTMLTHKGWKHEHLAKALDRINKRVARMKKKHGFERFAMADDPGKHLKALRGRNLGDDKAKPWDEEMMVMDERSGLKTESHQFIKASHWPGGKEHIPSKAKHLHQIVPQVGSPASDDEDLVEVTHHKVLAHKEINGAVVPVEAESVSTSHTTVLTVHTKWSGTHVNEPVPASEFEKGTK